MRWLRGLTRGWRGLDVPTHTDLGETWADLLALVPRRAQRRAIELALIIQGSHAYQLAETSDDSFSRGLERGRADITPTADDGFQTGWERGRTEAMADVLGHTGAPALPRHDADDEDQGDDRPLN